MNDKQEIYHRKLGKLISEQGRFIGYLFLLLGIAAACFLSFVAIPILLFAGIVLVNNKGVKIDFKTGVYKEYKSVLWIETGTWKVLPMFKYISIFRTISKTTLEANTALTIAHKDYIYKLKLVDPKLKEGVLVFSTLDKNLAIKDAEYLSAKLGIAVMDNSVPIAKTAADKAGRRR
jgi:hypothetical protein